MSLCPVISSSLRIIIIACWTIQEASKIHEHFSGVQIARNTKNVGMFPVLPVFQTNHLADFGIDQELMEVN